MLLLVFYYELFAFCIQFCILSFSLIYVEMLWVLCTKNLV